MRRGSKRQKPTEQEVAEVKVTLAALAIVVLAELEMEEVQ